MRRIILAGLIVASAIGGGLFAYDHRAYPAELAALVADYRQPLPETWLRTEAGGLGPYYLLPDQAMRPTATPEEEETLARGWQAPVAYGLTDHPVAIAQDGLSSYSRYVASGDARFLQRARSAADLLLQLQRADGSWRYSVDFNDLPAGWASAMAQGQGVSLLLRVGQDHPFGGYREAATHAVEFMMTPVEAGGTMAAFADGTPLLEEYPGSSFSPYTLNGSIFALWGLRDYAIAMSDQKAMDDFVRLSDALAAKLPMYDTGSWSLYSLSKEHRHLASRGYHRVHIVQMDLMAKMTGDERWRVTRESWAGYRLDEVRMSASEIWWQDTADRFDTVMSR